MRVVTFQSREITRAIMDKGKIETVEELVYGRGSYTPANLRRIERDRSFIRLDNDRVLLCDDDSVKDFMYEIHKSKKKQHIFPFYAYHKHSYCGDMRNMSIYTIYHLASHFIAYMGYDLRDIIELEVPEDEILETRTTSSYEECLLPYIKKEWVVSILWFEDYADDTVYGETSLMYKNEVFNFDTYRMCYGESILLSGHGHGDKVECCMSPDLIDGVIDTSIQRDYVQPAVYMLFKKYLYTLRHGMDFTEMKDIKGSVATIEMPDILNKDRMLAFNVCKTALCKQNNITVFSNDLSYTDRIKLLDRSMKESHDSCETITAF